MLTITLSNQQLQKLRQDMDQQVELLTDSEILAISTKVNTKINLPFLKEEKELIVFTKIIRWVDRQLYQLLPNEYYVLIRDASDGISKAEAKNIKDRLTPLINNVVNIPILTEKMEAKLIGLVLGIIIHAMIKGLKLEERTPEN